MSITDRRGRTVDGTDSSAQPSDPNAGLAIKTPCRAATTVAITLSGLQTVDGCALASGDRVLVKDQTDLTENGIYNASSGNWTRALDFDGSHEIVQGTQVRIAQGTTLGSGDSIGGGGSGSTTGSSESQRIYFVSSAGPITVGTSDIEFTGDSIVSSPLLTSIASLTSTGIIVNAGSGDAVTRTITAPAAGITITNGDGIAGNPTLVLANDLAGLEGLSSTGFAARTTTDTWASRTLAEPAAGFTITNPAGIAGNPTFALANDLAALEGLSTTGVIVRTADGTATTRTLTGTANEIAITDGNGISGVPTFSLPASLTFTSKTVTGGTFASPTAITGLPNPTNAQDAATKAYVDGISAGLVVKTAVGNATTGNITLSGEQTLDGVLTSTSRVLVKAQTAPAENGIYVSAAGAWSRATDMDTWAEVPSALVFVSAGTTNGSSSWFCTSVAGGTINTTAITWTQFSASSTYTATGGITLTGSQFSITTNGITDGMIRQGTALTVIGRSANSTGNVADISASSDYNILRRSGTALGFGSIDLSQSGAVGSSVLAAGNGGTGLSSLGSGVATFLGTPSSANLAAAVTGETGSGALVFGTSPTIATPLIAGVTDASSAAVGNYGEYRSSTQAAGSSIGLTTNTPATVAALASLPAGDWDVSATGYVNMGATTDAQEFVIAIGNPSFVAGVPVINDLLTEGQYNMTNSLRNGATGNGIVALTLGPFRFNLSTPTTIYLVARGLFPSGSMGAYGNIRARRIR